jgi:hypothetical protein
MWTGSSGGWGPRLFLPTACPELNPPEGVWKYVKGRVLADEPTPDPGASLRRACESVLSMTGPERLRVAGVLAGNFSLRTEYSFFGGQGDTHQRIAAGVPRYAPGVYSPTPLALPLADFWVLEKGPNWTKSSGWHKDPFVHYISSGKLYQSPTSERLGDYGFVFTCSLLGVVS